MDKEGVIDVIIDEFGLQKIVINNSSKNNALDLQMMKRMTTLLQESNNNPRVLVTSITGRGKFFTSGINLLSNIAMDSNISISDHMLQAVNCFREFIQAFIEHSKPLVAVVNGPTVGLGVTILPHCDYVFASEKATFCCPFVSLGLVPEGCSSLLFPQLMGYSKASQMLLFGEKISAVEAEKRNLVTEVVNHDNLDNVWHKVRDFCSLPHNSILSAKALLRNRIKSSLTQVNMEECDILHQKFLSSEFWESLARFSKKKSKL